MSTEALHREEAVALAENREACCPCVLLLDMSSSMRGRPLTALQAGLRTFQAHLRHDALTRRRIEIAAMAFDSDARVVQDFVTAEQFIPPMLTAQGLTRMGLAIHQALDMLQRRKAQYHVNGVICYRPWILMITDGEPQGGVREDSRGGGATYQGGRSTETSRFLGGGWWKMPTCNAWHRSSSALPGNSRG